MGENPYLNDDDDADILNPKQTEGISNGTGRKKLSVRGVDGQALPEELQTAISHYVDQENVDFGVVVSAGLPVEFKSIAWMFEYFSDYSRTKSDGPVIMAVVDILDEISDGKVTMLAHFYESERKILWTQSIKRIINVFLNVDFYSNNPYSGEVAMFIEAYADIINFVYDTAVNEYRALGAKLGKDPDEEFIQTGVLSERSTIKGMAMGNPYANREV